MERGRLRVKDRWQAVGGWIHWSSERGRKYRGRKIDGGEGSIGQQRPEEGQA